MNAFLQHHKHNINFHYRCFDRILINAAIQTFQEPVRAVYFFREFRQTEQVSRDLLRDIADQYQNWVTNRSQRWNAPILDDPDGRRDDFMETYFTDPLPDQVVGIIKAREPARILVSIGKKNGPCHLEFKRRWVNQFNFYLNDSNFGRMFVRVCPYFPFAARIYINQHFWLANRMREEGIRFRQCANAFVRCSNPKRLQQLADGLLPYDLITCGQKWLTFLVPFFTAKERASAACQHRLFLSQVEYSDNIVFRRRAALDALSNRLLDANRTIGQPDTIRVIFGRRVTKRFGDTLQTTIQDLHLGNPVIRTDYKKDSVKQYVRDHLLLRTEATSYHLPDLGVGKSVENLPKARKTLHQITERYLDVQQDILETFVDRGQLRRLSEPSITSSGKRIPGLKLDNPRQLAVMQALVRFCHLATGDSFKTKQIHLAVAEALGYSVDEYKLSSLRYDLAKLRGKGLVQKVPRSRRYQLLPKGYRLCVVFLKLFEKIYAPLTAGLLAPFPGDSQLSIPKIAHLDKLYRAIVTALDKLVRAVGLKAA
ncbi:MAG: hypothetical protein ABSC02_16115 [Acidobacteriota bacterium]|jgi:hypothetical protein